MPDTGSRIVISRPRGAWQDVVRSYRIYVDDELVGKLKAGQSLVADVKPGRHRVVARIDWSGSPTLNVEAPRDGDVNVRVEPNSMTQGFFSSDKWLKIEELPTQ